MEIAQPSALVLPEQSARDWQAKKLGQIAFVATMLFGAQLYLSLGQWMPFLEPLHLPMVLSCIGLSALVLQRVLGNQPLWMGWRTFALGIYAGAAVLSLTWTIDRAASIPAVSEVLKHFLFFIAVINTATTPARVRSFIALYAGAAIAPGWGTFNNWMHDELLVEGFRGRWLGVMADPNHDAMALVGAVPILLYLAIGRGHGFFKRLVGIAGTSGAVLGIVATHSRGGTVGLGVAGLVFALMSRRKGLALVVVLVLGASVMLFAPRSFWERNETIAQYHEDLSVTGRLEAWQVAQRAFSEHPFLGVGEGAFLAAWGQYAPIDSDRLFGHRYVAHNLFFELLGELGLVGVLGLGGMIFCAIWSAWRARNGELGGEARTLLASLAGYLVCQMFAGYTLSWFLYTLCAFATCCDIWGRKKAAELGPAA